MSYTGWGHSHQHPMAWMRHTPHPKVLCSHSAAQELLAEGQPHGCRAHFPFKMGFFSLFFPVQSKQHTNHKPRPQPSQPWRNPGWFTPDRKSHLQTGNTSSPHGYCDSLKWNPAAPGIICIPNPNILCHPLQQKPTAF